MTPDFKGLDENFGLDGLANYSELQASIANKIANLPPDLKYFKQAILDLYNATGNEQYKYFLNIIGEYNINSNSWSRANLLNSVFKAFDLQKKDVKIENFSGSDSYTLSVFENNSANKLKDVYSNNYFNLYGTDIINQEVINNFNKAFEYIKDSGLEKSKAIINAYSKIGISLNPKTNIEQYTNDEGVIIPQDKVNLTSQSVSYGSLLDTIHAKINSSFQEKGLNMPGIFTNSSDIKGWLSHLTEAQSKFNPDVVENSSITPDGKSLYALQLNNFISNWSNRINDINIKYKNNSEIRIQTLLDTFPEFNYPSYTNLRWYKQIVTNGYLLKTEELKEVKTNDSSESTGISDWTPITRIRLYYQNIADSNTPLMRSADRGTMLLFKFINNNNNIVNNNVRSFEYFAANMRNYLEVEMNNSIEYLKYKNDTGNSIEYVDNNFQNLRFFKDIIRDNTLNNAIKSFINDPNQIESASDFIKRNIPAIDRNIYDWFITVFNTEKSFLERSGVLGTYKEREDSKKTLVYLFDKYTQLEDGFNLDNKIKECLYTHICDSIEQSTFILGDPGQYKSPAEIVKRIKLYDATRYNLNLSEDYMAWLNKFYPNPTKSGENRTKVKSYVVKDKLITNTDIDKIKENILNNLKFTNPELSEYEANFYAQIQADTYKEINTTDAAAYLSLPFYRDLMMMNNNWDNTKETDYQLEMEGKRAVKSQFGIIKTQGVAKLLNLSGYNLDVNTLYKHAPMPLIPSVIRGTTLESLHNKMNSSEGQADIFQFKSAVKAGVIKFNDKIEEFSEETINNLDTSNTQVTNLSDLGVQQDTEPKEENMVTAGKQIRTVLLSNLYKDGKVLGDTQEEQNNIQLLVDNYTKASDEVVSNLTKDALEDLGFIITPEGNVISDEDSY